MSAVRDFSKVRQARLNARGERDEALTLVQGRYADKLTDLWLNGGPEAVDRTKRAAALVRSYRGRSSFMLSVQHQARAGGPTWLPSPKQTDAVLRICGPW